MMNEYIDTIFYFADTIQEYQTKHQAGLIHPRTIAFVAEDRGIYKNGVLYGRMSDLDLKEIIENIFKESPYILPIATKYTGGIGDHIGGVMGGEYITVNTENGVISVNISELFNDPSVQQLVKNVISKEYIESKYIPKTATYDNLGVVQIKKDGGILVNGGLISIDPDINKWGKDIKDGLKGADGSTPTIGSDGYWYINGRNTGVKAQGEKGEKGDPGEGGSGGSSTGTYVTDIIAWYLLTNLGTEVSTTDPGWSTTPSEPNSENRYLWRKDLIKYSDTTFSFTKPYIASIWLLGPRGEVGPGGGFDPENDEYIKTIYNYAYNNYLLGQSLIDGELTRIGNLVDSIDQEIRQRVIDMLEDALVIQKGPQGEVQAKSNFGQEDVETYLLQIGMWDVDKDGNIVTKWTKLEQDISEIRATSNTLVEFTPERIRALQSLLDIYSDKNEAGHELASFLADLNSEKEVVRWLYSGITGKAIDGKTWEDLVSAAWDATHGIAASNLHTEVTQGLDGSFVASGSFISMVEDALRTKLAAAGIINLSKNDWALSELFSRVANNEYALNSVVQVISSKLDALDPYSQALMISDCTVYLVVTERRDGKNVPVLDSSGHVQYVYYDGRDGRPTKWEITNENGWTTEIVSQDGSEVRRITYPYGSVVDVNPGSNGTYAKVIKSGMHGGFITTSTIDSVITSMFAEDKLTGVKASIDASVRDGLSTVQVNADLINLNGQTNFLNAIGNNITAKNVVITGSNDSIEGGIVSGSYIPYVLTSNNINVGDIRIWAGHPTNPLATSLSDAPFTVDKNGVLKATNADIKGIIKADTFIINNLIGQRFPINDGPLEIVSDHSPQPNYSYRGEVFINESGNSDHYNTSVLISNEVGLQIINAENAYGHTGSFSITPDNRTNGGFKIKTSGYDSNNLEVNGTGYTGRINGANFINGICVGPA